MYCYSNDGLSFRLVHEEYTPIDGEKIFGDILGEEELKANFPAYADKRTAQIREITNYPIVTQINNLEANGHRATRNILLAQLAGQTPNPTDIAKLQEVEIQIQNLRGQLMR